MLKRTVIDLTSDVDNHETFQKVDEMRERELLTISQYVRQHFGIEQAIYLLENISQQSFNQDTFFEKNLRALTAKLEEKHEEEGQAITLFDNLDRLEQIQALVKRIHNIYTQADIKKAACVTAESKQQPSYRIMLEALMWLDGQRQACITGLKMIDTKNVIPVVVAPASEAIPASVLQGARALLHNTIGLEVEDRLQKLSATLAATPVEQILAKLKSENFYSSLISALNRDSRAGFDTYLPQATTQQLTDLIDEYLISCTHMTQAIKHEKNIVRISQYIREHYGIPLAVKLLTDIEKPGFNTDAFFNMLQMPQNEFKQLIDSIHKFYLYADIKKNDNLFDAEDPQSKKLFESEMWIGLQRRCCIQGMTLIYSGQVYQNKSIIFDRLDQPVEILQPKEEKQESKQDNEQKQINKKQRDEFSVLEDAQLLLDGLTQTALQVSDEKDDASQPYYGTSDENDDKYDRTHRIAYLLQTSGLPENRFFAASELLDNAITRLRDSRRIPAGLSITFSQGMDRITLWAQHDRQPIDSPYKRLSSFANLPAPVSEMPFSQVWLAIQENLSACFANWQVSATDNTRLIKTFNQSDDLYITYGQLTNIEKSCKEINKQFRLMHSADRNNALTVSKDSIEQAKALLGYSDVKRFAESPSITQILIANSNVLQNPAQGNNSHSANDNRQQQSHFQP